MFCSNISFASSIVLAFFANTNIFAPNSRTTSFKSSGQSPCKAFIASFTSNEFPTAKPSGCDMSVKIQTVSLLANFPISIISFANFSASFFVFMNAPLPTVMSITIF